MSVIIGEVETFPNVQPDKTQVLKIGEECMEVFSAWERLKVLPTSEPRRLGLIDECADVFQAVSNLLDALGVHDMRRAMERCEQRNRDRGRFDADV